MNDSSEEDAQVLPAWILISVQEADGSITKGLATTTINCDKDPKKTIAQIAYFLAIDSMRLYHFMEPHMTPTEMVKMLVADRFKHDICRVVFMFTADGRSNKAFKAVDFIAAFSKIPRRCNVAQLMPETLQWRRK